MRIDPKIGGALPPVNVFELPDHRFHVGRLRDVTAHEPPFGSKLVDEPLGLATLFLAPTGHDHLGPLLGEGDCRCGGSVSFLIKVGRLCVYSGRTVSSVLKSLVGPD